MGWRSVSVGMGALLGAGSVFFFDPRRGKKRRHEVREQALRAARRAGRTAEVAALDLSNRSRGLVHAVALPHGVPANDEVVSARVRAKLGRVCSHPHVLCVNARSGIVELTGHVLSAELPRILEAIQSVGGVVAVVNELELHDTAADLPFLQGGRAVVSQRFPMRELWPPAARVGVGALGASLCAAGLAKRGPAGLLAACGGALLLARSVENLPLKRVLGMNVDGELVTVRKTLHILAPVEDVYAYYRAFENFPRFMSHVLEVRRLASGRWRWTVDGPFFLPVRWEAEIVEERPNELVAWRSVGASAVHSKGRVSFERVGDRETALHVELSYNPPLGAFGHLVSRLLGRDAKTELDDDLLRLKGLLEHGKASGKVGHVTLDELPLPSLGRPTSTLH